MDTVSTRASRYDIARRAAARIDTIEWEELPSLTGLLSKSLADAGARHIAAHSEPGAFDGASRFNVWTETMLSSLDQLEPPTPFRETIRGLITREVTEPHVFRQFFGSIAAVR